VVPGPISQGRGAALRTGIIGGSGFVGSGIRKSLEAGGIKCDIIEKDNFRSFQGASFDLLVNANGNSKKYLAAEAPAEDFQASVASVQQSLTDYKAKLYIYCSSVDIYPDHEDPDKNGEEVTIDTAKLSLYGFHKYLAEQIVRRYAPSWLILRFGGFVGEGLKKNSIYDILHNVPLRVDLDSTYQYLSTASAGSVIAHLVERGIQNTIINVCGDGSISLREIVDQIPGYKPAYAVDRPARERYEVSIKRLKGYCAVPKTRDTVIQYLREYRSASIHST